MAKTAGPSGLITPVAHGDLAEMSLDEGEDQGLDSGTLKRMVIAAINAPGYKPPTLPDVVMQLMKIANDPNANFSKVEKVVSSDPGIAAKIVATANSAFYARGAKVESIHTAISRLGLSQLRDIAFQESVKASVFRVPEYQKRMTSERTHALGAAMLAREICKVVSIDADMAFLCGLLHDIGKPIIIGILADLARKQKTKMLEESFIENAIKEIHASLGGQICKLWGLPAPIIEAVELHHQPCVGGKLIQLAALVGIANMCCHHAGIGCPRQPSDEKCEQAFQLLKVNPGQVRQILNMAENLAQASIDED